MIKVNYESAISEANLFARDLEQFADPASRWMVAQFASGLEFARQNAAPGASSFWRLGGVEDGELLRTLATDEELEDGGVRAGFAFWLHLKQGALVKKKIDHFEVMAGSCHVELEGADGRLLHKFSVDVQTVSGPGSHLHLQSKGNYQNTTRFTELPRMPLIAVLPMDVISIVLHEVFPTRWPKHLAGSASAKFHGPKQRSRVASVLDQWAERVASTVDPFGDLRSLRLKNA